MSKEVTVEDGIKPLIHYMNTNFAELNGAYKVSLLKTVAAHFENLTVAQATAHLISETFKKL